MIAHAIGPRVTPVRGVHVQISKRLSTDGDGACTSQSTTPLDDVLA